MSEIHCEACGEPVSVAGDDREGTHYYTNAGTDTPHICRRPVANSATPDRCPHCSFQPESLNDYCEKHRPVPESPAPIAGKAEMPEWAAKRLARIRECNAVEPYAQSDPAALVIVLADASNEYARACARAVEMCNTAERDRERLLSRLAEIARIIETVDDRAMAADGPVTPAMQEMTQAEMSRIYKLAFVQPTEDTNAR